SPLQPAYGGGGADTLVIKLSHDGGILDAGADAGVSDAGGPSRLHIGYGCSTAGPLGAQLMLLSLFRTPRRGRRALRESPLRRAQSNSVLARTALLLFSPRKILRRAHLRVGDRPWHRRAIRLRRLDDLRFCSQRGQAHDERR